jgi:glycosidase
MGRILERYEAALGPGETAPRLARYTDNHDEGRGLFRYGAGAVRAVNRLIFLSPHAIPFLLCGQEFGAVNRPTIHERLRACEKGRRILTPETVRWEDGVEFEGNLFARGREERNEWHRFYRDLIRLRRDHPELQRGGFERLDMEEHAPPSERSVLAFDRRLGRSSVRCAVNLGPASHALGGAALLSGEPLYGRLEGDRLGPFEALAIRIRL